MTASEAIRRYRIIAIIRGVAAENIPPLAEALYQGGIRLLEVTFDQAKGQEGNRETAAAIDGLRRAFDGRLTVGAGTVLSDAQVRLAAQAGAEYIVSPNVDASVIRQTRDMGLVSVPGALTPTEIVTAWVAGANYVKLFPLGNLGLSYARAVMAPLGHIPMLAVGGVDENNLGEFLSAGFAGAGIGGNLVKKSLVESGGYAEITRLALQYTAQISGGDAIG